MHDATPSTWVISHLRGAQVMARADAARSEELARQVKLTMASAEREPGRCAKCGRAKPRASTLAACENCRERDSRQKRKKAEAEGAAERARRLEERRAGEQARRDRLRAAGVRREADRKAKARQLEKGFV